METSTIFVGGDGEVYDAFLDHDADFGANDCPAAN